MKFKFVLCSNGDISLETYSRPNKTTYALAASWELNKEHRFDQLETAIIILKESHKESERLENA